MFVYIGFAVERLGSMAGTINEELKEQNQMLNKLTDDLGLYIYVYGVTCM